MTGWGDGQSLKLKNTGLGETPPPASREVLRAQSHSLRPLALLPSAGLGEGAVFTPRGGLLGNILKLKMGPGKWRAGVRLTPDPGNSSATQGMVKGRD